MRYRDLETGAFITRDPLGFVDGPNVYAYVNQNPWTKFDPKGLAFGEPYDDFDSALVACSIDLWNYTPKKGDRPPTEVEYAANIYQRPDKKYSYTAP